MTALVVALGVAVALLAVLVAGLLRSHAEILRALHELGAGLDLDGRPGAARPGNAGPAVADGVARPRSPRDVRVPESLQGTLLAADGGEEAFALSLDGPPVLLAFLSSGCSGCTAFWEAFGTAPASLPAGARLVVVAHDAEEEDLRALRRHAVAVPLVLSSATWDAFVVPGSPYVVLVRDGRVAGEGSGASWPQVVDLLEQALAGRPGRRGRAGRHDRDDAALLAAGIGPGHPSLDAADQPAEQATA